MTIAQTRVFWFFMATFAFSWFGILVNWLWPSAGWPALNSVGPALAALLVITVTNGSCGLRRFWSVCTNFRAPPWLYGFVLLGPLALHSCSIWLTSIVFGVSLSPLPTREWTEFLTLIPIVLLAGPLFEELSFLGYGQLQLERDLSPLISALLIGLGVLLWHLPMFVQWTLAGQISLFFFCFSITVIYVWMLKTGGSVWPPLLWHASMNYFGERFLGNMITDQGELFIHYSILTTIFTAFALFLVWRYGRPLRKRERRGKAQ